MSLATPASSSAFDAVLVGGSAGALEPLAQFLGALRADFPLPLVVSMHLPARSAVVDVLQRASKLPVSWAEPLERVHAGRVYVAPRGVHLTLVQDGVIGLWAGPRLRFSRPSVNALFTTAATSCGARALAVLLSGAGADGADGCVAVARMGGTVLVQHPGTAKFKGMPSAALQAVPSALCVPPSQLGKIVTELSAARTSRVRRAAGQRS